MCIIPENVTQQAVKVSAIVQEHMPKKALLEESSKAQLAQVPENLKKMAQVPKKKIYSNKIKTSRFCASSFT